MCQKCDDLIEYLAIPFCPTEHLAPAQEEVVSLKTVRWGFGNVRFLTRSELNLKGINDATGDFVLDLENVGEIAIVAFGPEMSAVRSVDKMRCDADSVAGLANAALHSELDAELSANIGHTERFALVDEGRVSRDDEKTGYFAQIRDEVFGDPVSWSAVQRRFLRPNGCDRFLGSTS